jgi:membrane-associated phospholipid phosphatase
VQRPLDPRNARPRRVLWSGFALGVLLCAALIPFDPALADAIERVRHGLRDGPLGYLHQVIMALDVYGAGVAAPLLAVGVYLADRRRPQRAVALLLVVAAVGLTGQIAKMSIGRVRPDLARNPEGARVNRFVGPWGEPSGSDSQSFPSGHSANAFAQSSVLASFFPPAAPALYGLAAVASLERFYRGRHYVSDVLAGALLGYLLPGLLLRSARFQRLCLFIARPLAPRGGAGPVASGRSQDG